MRRIGFLVMLLLGQAAHAADVPRDAVGGVAWAVVAASRLNAREEPSTDAAVAFKIPRGTPVAVVEELGQPANIDGAEDSWTFVAVEQCTDDDCTRLRAGWVADSWLAYQERFEPLEEWRDGAISGNDGERDFSYRIGADGSFEYATPPCDGEGCELFAPFDGCREEEFREGDECVGRGDLYRYRSLVWARGYGYLFVDGAGNLCSVHSERDGAPRMCDR